MTKLISTITLASALCLGIVNSLNVQTCNQIQNLVRDYFDESIVSDMMCIAYHEATNPKSNAIGIWNLDPKHCHTVCKSFCNSERDLLDITINTQCAERIYLEYGLKGWSSITNGQCNESSFNFCGETIEKTSDNAKNEHKQHSSHSSSSSTRDSSSSSSSSTDGGYSGSGSGTSGSNDGSTAQTGHYIPGQSGHGIY